MSCRGYVGFGAIQPVAAVSSAPTFLAALNHREQHVAVPPAPTIILGNHQRHAQGDRGGRGRGYPGTGAGVCVCGYTLSWAPQIFHKETGGYQRQAICQQREPHDYGHTRDPGGGGNRDRGSFSYPPSLTERDFQTTGGCRWGGMGIGGYLFCYG